MVAPKLRFSNYNVSWYETKLNKYVIEYKGGAPLTPEDFVSSEGVQVIPKKSISSGGVLNLDNTIFCTHSFYKEHINNSVDSSYLITTLRDLVPSGPNIGYVVKNKSLGYFILAQGVYGFRIDENINEVFLMQYSNTEKYRKKMNEMMVGSTQVHIRNNDFFSMSLYLTSLPEQTKIANFLSAVDERIQQVSQIHELLTQYKKGVMQKIFSQELRFKDENGQEFGEWEIRRIKEILTIGSGRDYKHLNNGNIPVYGTGGLMTTVDSFLYEGETVCIGRKGTIDKPFFHSGKIWTVDTLFYTHKFIDSLPKFVYQLFLTINWKEHNEASGVPSLSKSTIESIIVNIPTLPEQTKIANFLSAIDDKINQAQSQLTALQEYKRGLLQQMFV